MSEDPSPDRNAGDAPPGRSSVEGPLDAGELQAIFHSVNDAIFVHDGETGEIIDVNETMCEMYGYGRAEARDLTIEDLSSGEEPYTQDQAVEYVRKAAAGDPQVFEWHARDSDDELFWVEVSMRRAFVGDELRILVIVRDITERKQRERRLEAAKADLERSNEKLERFASVVSHDLRNPLSVAEAYVEALEERIDDPELAEYVEEVAWSHDRMRRIVEDVLTMTRQGGTIDRRETVDLFPLARRAWSNVDTGAADFENALSGTVEGDPDRLLHVFENLFRNAVEHNDAPPTVRCGLLETERGTEEGDDSPGGFFVEDDGDGIPEDRREAVFDHGHTTAEGGTGLGLSIVEEVVDAHGWGITLVESPDGGARFEIRTDGA